jgi:uncharacterized protein YkwD
MAIASAPKRQHHHRKARGEHHRHTKHYLKAYHPYLPLLLLVIVGLAVNSFWNIRTGVLGASTNMSASSLLLSTNRERLTHNQDAIRLNDQLSSAAQAKANDMVAKDYWSHTTPSGQEPWAFVKKSGYTYFAAGENLAYGFNDADQAISGWMNSPEHRANLLNPDYQDVGFGIATSKDFQHHGKTMVIVAMYGQPSALGAGDFSTIASTSPTNLPIRNVARVQLITGGQAPWSLFVATVMMFTALLWFATRHVKAWKRVIVESEEFIWHHPLLDIVIVASAVAGFLLTRGVGFIQ